MRMGTALRQSMRLALADASHEWRLSLCLVAGLMAVLSPLLVLFGLKFGIVSAMTERLLANPLTLEVRLVGSYALKPEWFDQMRQRPEVAFVLPRTRSLAATLDAMDGSGRALPTPLAMHPTQAGDPLLKGLAQPSDAMEVLIGQPVAEQLRLSAGGEFRALLSRRLDGRQEAKWLTLRVVGVVPEALAGQNAVFVGMDLLIAAERYRSGFRVPMLGVEDGTPDGELPPFASARIFARDLDGVAPLAVWLRAQGLEVQTEMAQIELVRAIDRSLTVLFGVLAAIAVAGFLVSLAASLWANVERKRRDLALMRLIGFPRGAIFLFPATQAALVATLGTSIALLFFLAVAALLNRVFADGLPADMLVCRLMPAHAALAYAGTLCLALSASIIGGYRAIQIDPADSLRDL